MNNKRLLCLVGILFVLSILISSAQLTDVQALLGDLDISGIVDDDDLAIIDAAYGTSGLATPQPPAWDIRADIDMDDYVDIEDLALAGRSYADNFNFHAHRRVSNGYNNNPDLTNPYWCDAAIDSQGRVHIIWEEYRTGQDYLFYTQLDMAGNALIEDVMISNDSDYSRLAIGPDNSAHIVYVRRFSSTGLYYTKIDPDGSFVGPGSKVAMCDDCEDASIAVDEYNNAHIVYNKYYDKAFYRIIGDSGQLLPETQLNPGSTRSADSLAITVSPDGARHILWHQSTGVGGGELHYTRITRDGIVTANNRTVAVLQGTYNHRHYYLGADSKSAVYFVYYDYRSSTPGIYWSRMDADGTLEAETLISSTIYSAAPMSIPYVIDADNRLHLITNWTGGGGLTGYASLDHNGNFLVPFQPVEFDASTYSLAIVLDANGQAMIISPAYTASPEALFIVSTVPDPAAYDLNRADLVLDKAHLAITDQLLRINESADITLTITNGGPAPATGVALRFSYLDVGGTTSHFDVPVADLPAFTSLEVNQVIEVPDFEEVDSWEVTISVSTITAETSTDNNQVVAPFGVVPPPHHFNLEVQTFDETDTPDNQSLAEPLMDAELTVNCDATEYKDLIDSTDSFNIFWDIPLDTSIGNAPLYPTTCTVTLSKPGYSEDSVTVTAQRYSVENPYAILLSEARPLKLYINTWGRISGFITNEGRAPIENALLKLDTGQQTTTDLDGAFAFEKIAAGDHSLRIWAANYLPIPAYALSVAQGKTCELNIPMQDTKRVDIFGVVRNSYSQALPGALVEFFGNSTLVGSTTTGNDGTFAFYVDPYEEGTTYRLDTTLSFYEPSTITLAGMVPGLPLEQDVSLTFSATGGDLSTSDSIISWKQDERWCKSYDDDEDLPLRVKILQAIGSKWCPSFQTVVNWGAFEYELGLNYTEDELGKTVNALLIHFTNEEFISYDVSSGMWHSGGESIPVTAQRIDWVELIAIDGNGNPVGTYAWRDDAVRYSTTQDNPADVVWWLPIEELAPTWSTAAIRIYYTIGQYDELEENFFKDWNPPADLGLAGSGAPSGANRQVITWMLSANNSSMRYSLADYRSALYPPDGLGIVNQQVEPTLGAEEQGSSEINVANAISVVAVIPGPARVGVPYAVDITLSSFESRPVYAMQFDMVFNTDYLQLVGIEKADDFAGPYGSWHRDLDLAAANSAEELHDMAVVRLAATSGLSNGGVLRLIFMPVKSTTTSTTLNIQNVDLADLNGQYFAASSVTDLSVVVEKAKLFLPLIFR